MRAACIRQRFHYKHPGLYGLIVRMFVAPQAAQIADSSHIAGCRSWVELPAALSTRDVTPVMDDDTFARAVAEVKARIS